MHLTEEQVLKFQKIYFQCFNKKISKKEAYNSGLKLINLLEAIYKNIDKK
jgi:hypothetical protein